MLASFTNFLYKIQTYFEYVQVYPDTQLVEPAQPLPPPERVNHDVLLLSRVNLHWA